MLIKKARTHILVIFLLMITSCIMSYAFLRTGLIETEGDWLFHASRVEEIYSNLQSGTWLTFISTHTMQKTGVGSFLFYPVVFLYPWAILKLLLNPIVAYYIWYGIFNFLTFVISYYCMFFFSKNVYRSFVFSMLYTLLPYRLYLGHSVLGEFIATTFVPLAFLGIYEVLWNDKKRWYILSVGMTLLVYSHLLSAFMTCEIMAIMLVIWLFNREKDYSRLIYLVISAIITILLALPIILPFLTDYIGTNIGAAYPGINPYNMSDFWMNSISNTATNTSIGIVLIVTVLFGWYWIKDRKLEFHIYLLGLLCLVCATSVFPWWSLRNTILGVIQLPYRYTTYVGLFISVSASYLLVIFFVKYFKKYNFSFFILGIMMIGIGGFFGSVTNFSKFVETINANGTTYLKRSTSKDVQNLPDRSQVDKNNYKYQFEYAANPGETDYYPKVSQVFNNQANANSIINNIGYIGDKSVKLSPISKPNELVFKIDSNSKTILDLPIVAYRNTEVYVNGLKQEYSFSDRGTPKIKLNIGKNNIKVKYIPSKLYYFGIFVTMGVWLVLVLYIVYSKVKSRRV